MEHLKQEPLKGSAAPRSGLSRIHSRTNRQVREILQTIDESTIPLQELYNESHDLAGCKREDETTEEFEEVIFGCWNTSDFDKAKECLTQALEKISALEQRIIERIENGDGKLSDEDFKELKNRQAQQRKIQDSRKTVNM